MNMDELLKAEKILEAGLRTAMGHMDTEYAITSDGKIMAITKEPLSDHDLFDVFGVGRVDAFKTSNTVCISKDAANAIADILEGKDDNEWTLVQKEAVELLFDVVNGIQYQSMIKWLDEYSKTHYITKEENK